MAFISGILFGAIFGIALIAAWKQMSSYRNAKRVAKATDIKVLGSLHREEIKKLCGDSFPDWISFPAFEQAKWLNKQLTKLWPFVADAATVIVKESVEPLLDDYRPPGITSLKFSKFSLGTVPPKIEGIRVQNPKHGQLVMDIDFRWCGNPSIVLAVEAAIVASLPIQLKNLEVYTVIRVIFQLCNEIPCISAVVVALLSEPKPKIQYVLKAVGGSLTAVPGLSDMIDDTVNSIVSDMLEWPHRIIVPLGGTSVDTSELELKLQGTVRVVVVKASGLKNMEMMGKSDPYVALHVRPLFKVKTKVVQNNLNPVWDETFEVVVEDKETQGIIFEVFDEDFGQDKRLGVVKLGLQGLTAERWEEFELKLLPAFDMLKIKDKKDRGTLSIKVLYHEFTKEEQVAAMEEEKRTLEMRKRIKESGVIGGAMGAVSMGVGAVGTGVGFVAKAGSGVGSRVGRVGSGLAKVIGRTFSGRLTLTSAPSTPRRQTRFS